MSMDCTWHCTNKMRDDQRVPFTLKKDDGQMVHVTLSKHDAINLGITLIEYAFAIDLDHAEYPAVSGRCRQTVCHRCHQEPHQERPGD